MLPSVAAHLAARHRTFIAWQKGDSDWDPESLGRDTIEPHEQGLRFGHVDVLIDAARDCLQWLACHRPEAAARWCAQLAGSETPLLRRLCVHTLSVRKNISACEKFDWLFANIGLNDDAAPEELSRIMRDIYPHVDPQRRRRAVETSLPTSLRHRPPFVDLYTGILAYFSDDPVGKWVPAFFSDATRGARLRFASEIERHLRRMDDAQQREWWERWLERYWTNRIEGVPKPLDDGEIPLMLLSGSSSSGHGPPRVHRVTAELAHCLASDQMTLDIQIDALNRSIRAAKPNTIRIR